jgi:ABC-type cobalamin/Fe3+-siderophores transport system ATPase subunit
MGGALTCPPVIDVEDLAVCAGRSTLLDLDRLVIASGEVVTLLGPNGAGKSTLLGALLGFVRARARRLEVLGEPVGELRGRRLCRLRRRVGYVPQLLAGRSEMPLTVREVVSIGRTGRAGLLRRLGRDDWQRVDEWIDRLGLGALAARAYGELSGGEQRKALIAKAMVQEPELLLLDEPTANLDLRWRERIVGTVDGLCRAGSLTTVMVCHELEVVPPSCGRVVVLRDGRRLADGKTCEVLSSELAGALYGRGLAVERRGGRYAVVPAGDVER